MWKNYSKKRELYYDKVIQLHYTQGVEICELVKLIPVNPSTIKNWISNFAAEQKDRRLRMKAQESQSPVAEGDVAKLQEELAKLKKELEYEQLKSAAYNEMINVAEKQFNISIRKKAGVKQ